MATWRLMAHHARSRESIESALRESRISIGWNCAGDLRHYETPAPITEAVRDSGNPNWPFAASQLWAFVHEMQPGDRVILRGRRVPDAVFEIVGPYEYLASGSKEDSVYDHRREARPITADPKQLWRESGGIASGFNKRWALVRLRH